MLTVTRAAYEKTLAERKEPVDVVPGDWDSAESTQTPDQAQQYLTLYESLQGFDERAALEGLTMPRLAFAGAEDTITYGPKWGNARVVISDALSEHRDELVKRGWAVELIPGADHMVAMQAAAVLPILVRWLSA
jgi:hypothetical protein